MYLTPLFLERYQMNDKLDRLYKLLPTVYRRRDAEQQWQLQALLHVIAEQVNIVEEDIAQLYENWLIQTCPDWLVPYISDLVGHNLRPAPRPPGNPTPPQPQHQQ